MSVMDKPKRRAALLSNITPDFIVAKLRPKYDVYIPDGYDTWIQEVFNPASALYASRPDAVVVLLDGTEARSWKNSTEAGERVALWKEALDALSRRIADIPVFVSTIDFRLNRIQSFAERKASVSLADEWYQFVQGKAEEFGNFYILDIADVIAETGRKQFYSDKMWYVSGMPYSREGVSVVAREIDRALEAAFGARKKIIALDLDNTLWGGVAGEDGLQGIELSDHKNGQRYYDFQRQFLEMKKRGVLLAVNSKNNEEDAEIIIRNHPAMLLRDDDFVSRKINWNDKAENLRDMERELNLTEGGFIFIDDNPAERMALQAQCPDALVPEFPADTSELLTFAETLWFDYCRPLRTLREDADKTLLYQKEAERKREFRQSLSLDDYLGKLEISADIHRMRPEEAERVAQLCGKTNQFNVTSKRYAKADIEAIAQNPNNAIYVAHMRDKYGDSGLVSVVILALTKTTVRIDTFLMSCRVMGRRLEDVIITELLSRYSGDREIIGEYVPTAKNIPVKDLFDHLGFELTSEDESGRRLYLLRPGVCKIRPVESYHEILFEGRAVINRKEADKA